MFSMRRASSGTHCGFGSSGIRTYPNSIGTTILLQRHDTRDRSLRGVDSDFVSSKHGSWLNLVMDGALMSRCKAICIRSSFGSVCRPAARFPLIVAIFDILGRHRNVRSVQPGIHQRFKNVLRLRMVVVRCGVAGEAKLDPIVRHLG